MPAALYRGPAPGRGLVGEVEEGRTAPAREDCVDAELMEQSPFDAPAPEVCRDCERSAQEDRIDDATPLADLPRRGES